MQASIDTALVANTDAIEEWHRAFAMADEDESERFFEAAVSLGQIRDNLREMVTALAGLANPHG